LGHLRSGHASQFNLAASPKPDAHKSAVAQSGMHIYDDFAARPVTSLGPVFYSGTITAIDALVASSLTTYRPGSLNTNIGPASYMTFNARL
jgi:hypothetical protein